MRWRREGDAVDIADWLQGLRLEKCAPAFDENAINWDVLSNLTTDDLQEIGGGALPAAPAPVRSSALAEAEIEFTRLSSYGFAKESSGTVQLFGDVPANLDGRAILLVDDIVDTGRSTAFAAAQLRQHGMAISGHAHCSTSHRGGRSKSRSTLSASRSAMCSSSARA
jgi:hypothetical protein